MQQTLKLLTRRVPLNQLQGLLRTEGGATRILTAYAALPHQRRGGSIPTYMQGNEAMFEGFQP